MFIRGRRFRNRRFGLGRRGSNRFIGGQRLRRRFGTGKRNDTQGSEAGNGAHDQLPPSTMDQESMPTRVKPRPDVGMGIVSGVMGAVA